MINNINFDILGLNVDGEITVNRRFFNKVFFSDIEMKNRYKLIEESTPKKIMFDGFECWDCGILKYKKL